MKPCLQCKKWFKQPEGKKEKKFCSDTCRSNFRHAKERKKKIKFVKPPPESYDAPKLTEPINDESLSFAKLKAEIPGQKGYHEYLTDLKGAEDMTELERVGKRIERSSISWKDKQALHAQGRAIAQDKFF